MFKRHWNVVTHSVISRWCKRVENSVNACHSSIHEYISKYPTINEIHECNYICIYIYRVIKKSLCTWRLQYSTSRAQRYFDHPVYIYIYVYMYTHTHTHIHTYNTTKRSICKGETVLKWFIPDMYSGPQCKQRLARRAQHIFRICLKTATCFDQSQQQTHGCTPNKVKVKITAAIYHLHISNSTMLQFSRTHNIVKRQIWS